jgi:hypothetical protein
MNASSVSNVLMAILNVFYAMLPGNSLAPLNIISAAVCFGVACFSYLQDEDY